MIGGEFKVWQICPTDYIVKEVSTKPKMVHILSNLKLWMRKLAPHKEVQEQDTMSRNEIFKTSIGLTRKGKIRNKTIRE